MLPDPQLQSDEDDSQLLSDLQKQIDVEQAAIDKIEDQKSLSIEELTIYEKKTGKLESEIHGLE